jgi:microcystin-dependent protein
MSEPFLSEIKVVSFNFPPKGWALCNGQLLPINQNQALFALLGTTYGGNGQTNFSLPDFRGRVPMHEGSGHILGEKGGQTAHTLTISELPAHNHLVNATNANGVAIVPGNTTVLGALNNAYKAQSSPTTLNPATIGNVGGSQAHNNMQPYTVLNFIIALQGIFPSQN